MDEDKEAEIMEKSVSSLVLSGLLALWCCLVEVGDGGGLAGVGSTLAVDVAGDEVRWNCSWVTVMSDEAGGRVAAAAATAARSSLGYGAECDC